MSGSCAAEDEEGESEMWRQMEQRRVRRAWGEGRGGGGGAWDRKVESEIDVKYVGIKAH